MSRSELIFNAEIGTRQFLLAISGLPIVAVPLAVVALNARKNPGLAIQALVVFSRFQLWMLYIGLASAAGVVGGLALLMGAAVVMSLPVHPRELWMAIGLGLALPWVVGLPLYVVVSLRLLQEDMLARPLNPVQRLIARSWVGPIDFVLGTRLIDALPADSLKR